MKALKIMAVQCITVSLPNVTEVTVKCIDSLHVKMCASQPCVQQFYTIKIKPFKICVHTLQREYVVFFCCCLNCFKKILNVKILKWKFCRKTHILSSVWPQSPSPNSSAPSAQSQGPVPNCWGSMQNDHNTAPTRDRSREHLAPL